MYVILQLCALSFFACIKSPPKRMRSYFCNILRLSETGKIDKVALESSSTNYIFGKTKEIEKTVPTYCSIEEIKETERKLVTNINSDEKNHNNIRNTTFINAITLMKLDESYKWLCTANDIKKIRLDLQPDIIDIIFDFAKESHINFNINYDSNTRDVLIKKYKKHKNYEQYLASSINEDLLFENKISYKSKFENFSICMEYCDSFWNWKMTITKYKKLLINIPYNTTTSYWILGCPHTLLFPKMFKNEIIVTIDPNCIKGIKSIPQSSKNTLLIGAFRSKPECVNLQGNLKPEVLWR